MNIFRLSMISGPERGPMTPVRSFSNVHQSRSGSCGFCSVMCRGLVPFIMTLYRFFLRAWLLRLTENAGNFSSWPSHDGHELAEVVLLSRPSSSCSSLYRNRSMDEGRDVRLMVDPCLLMKTVHPQTVHRAVHSTRFHGNVTDPKDRRCRFRG